MQYAPSDIRIIRSILNEITILQFISRVLVKPCKTNILVPN